MTRVFSSNWEWGCCGDPFEVGQDVDFGIAARRADTGFADSFPPELLATVDAVESHHEEAYPDRVRGTVVAVYEVTTEAIERRTLRRPGHGAPPDAVMPADGEEWPRVGREFPGGFFIGNYPSRYVIDAEPVPHSAELVPTRGVRLPREAPDDAVPRAFQPEPDPPLERRTRSRIGWVVDVEEEP